MKKYFLIFFFLTLGQWIDAQESLSIRDTARESLISIKKQGLLENVNFTLDMRLAFRHHWENGLGELNDDYSEFRNEVVALGISGKIHDKISFRFRNRFNRGGEVQTLDLLGDNIEIAYAEIEATPKTQLRLGKQFAYFGGFEYEFNPLEVLQYNDAQDNLTAYVTGIGVSQQIATHHNLGVQILNSRTMRYSDLFEGHVSDNIQEPKWPVAFVGKWEGNFFDGMFRTIYSYSYFKQVKDKGTHFVTLGNKFEKDRLKIMYDFTYASEEVDTKGIVTNVINNDFIAEDVLYIENWIRAEYEFSPKITGLLTLMTDSGFGKNLEDNKKGRQRLRTSYGIVPTIYYYPFKDSSLRFYLAFIGRSFRYTNYAREVLRAKNYESAEFRFGIIAPLLIF